MAPRRLKNPSLCFLALMALPVAHAGSPVPTSASPVIAHAGTYQLTEQMVQQSLTFAQFMAGADFTPVDAAALRADLITYFRKDPAQQMVDYEVLAKNFQGTPGLRRNASGLAVAIDRYKTWQSYANDREAFRTFQSYPFGRMVLKYNPVLVNSGGVIITRVDVDCQFYADTLVARAAGVVPPTQVEKEQFIRSLPSKFASMSQEQREYLGRAELRLASFRLVYEGSIKTRAVLVADIRKNVHAAADVWSEARQVENDSQYTGKYYQLFRSEELAAGMNAVRVNAAVLGLGSAGRSNARSGDINTPVGTR